MARAFPVAAVLACVAVWCAGPGATPARALDLLGWLGLGGDKTPDPTPDTLPFTIRFEAPGAPGSLTTALEDASNLYRLRSDALPSADSLARIAADDLARLTDAMWANGYYEARVTVDVAGVPLALGADRTALAARAANAYRGRAPVPVVVRADPGPLFALRSIRILDASGRPFPPEVLPRRVVGLAPGDPATSAAITAAVARITDQLRELGHPFAKLVRQDPVVDHPARAMDITLAFAPGPVAGIGDVSLSGLQTIDPAPVRSFIYTEPGDPYSPSALAALRRSVARMEGIASVRVREGDRLDRNGNLPIFVEVTERKPRAIGASALYSTTDGPEVRAYWTHRNLFGGGEVLRLEGSVFYNGQNFADQWRGKDSWDIQGLSGRFGFSFLKPGLWGTRNDLLVSAQAAREETESYVVRRAGGDIQIRHRWSDTVSAQAGVRFERGQAEDLLGRVDYTLVGLPVSVTYDSTDRPLDPTRGIKFTASATPYPTFLGSTVGMTVMRANGSTYWAIDEDARYILAGRIGFGSIVGASLAEVPANYRFFAGGGGSVRGYRYQSLAPSVYGVPVGGLSLLEGSIEARIKITDTIGIVPFMDAGNAFAQSWPDFSKSQKLRYSAGLGLRYYTPIGPIRLDVATPLDRQKGDRPVAVYVSVGQAF
jgi:translocation and assembly module TamA